MRLLRTSIVASILIFALSGPLYAATAIPKIIVTTPLLSVTVKSAPNAAPAGSTIHYTITVTNTDDRVVARNVAVTEKLPAGLTFRETGKRAQIWTLGATMQPHEKRTVAFDVVVGTSTKPGTYTDAITATADNYDPVQGSGTLTVTQPRVLGATTTTPLLPNTGTSPLLTLFGLGLLTVGLFGIVALRRAKPYAA